MSSERAPVVGHHTHTIERIRGAGLSLLRYGLVFLLVTIGSFKFFAFEAEAIRPLVSNSPFLAWLYEVLGIRGTAALFGGSEIIIATLIAARRWAPRVSGYASLAASGMFLVTLSFLLTTPGALAPTSPFNQFLLKDIGCSVPRCLPPRRPWQQTMRERHDKPSPERV